MTLAAVLAAYSAGYLIFRYVFHSKVIKELENLCYRFRRAQDEKNVCLTYFYTLITRDIPLIFCLDSYEKEFRNYLEKKKCVSEMITYHSGYLEKYVQYIDNLLRELDIDRLSDGPGPTETTVKDGQQSDGAICIEKNVFQNDHVYELIPEEEIGEIFIKTEEGA